MKKDNKQQKMKPTMGRLKRRGLSPIKPRKLTKQDIYPANNGKIIEQTTEQVSDKENDEDKDGHPEVIKSTVQEIQTNSTILSKQIKIVSQLNAKQIDGLISDRNTIKAYGLQNNMKY